VFRQLQEREELGTSLEQLLRRRDHALMSRQDASVIHDLEDQIESMRANIDYIQERIAESQTNIMQIEDSKVCVEFLFLLCLFFQVSI
jgi:Mg2+ and Co2+ transporter CorA